MPEDLSILFTIFSHLCDARGSFVPENRNIRSFFDERMERARGTGVAPCAREKKRRRIGHESS
jgi:hypothetical protein